MWVDAESFTQFVAQLVELEARRQGTARLEAMSSPDEFWLEFRSIDRAGHLGAFGRLQRWQFLSAGQGHHQAVEFGFCRVSLPSSGRWRHPPSNEEVSMPELSRFFGVIIRMYMEAGEPHHSPHFHAYYQDEAAVFQLDPVELIAGSLPRKQKRLVEAWAELHEAELLEDWQLLLGGQVPNKIDPIK